MMEEVCARPPRTLGPHLLSTGPPEGVRLEVGVNLDVAAFDRLSPEQTTAILGGLARVLEARRG